MEIDRRRFFAGLCGISSGIVAGCIGSDQDTEPESSEITVPDGAIDVTNHGADPSGSRSIVPTLDSVAADGAVLYFPDGEYRLDETWSFTEFEEFQMVGPEATIVPSDGFDSQLFRLHSRDRPATLSFEGFEFDLTASNTGGRVLDAQISSELVVRDVTAKGRVNVGSNLVRVDITDPNGSGLVERLSLPDGAAAGPDISGCYVGNRNRGDIRFVDCHIEGFPDNGLYADPPGGRMLVEGGTYANNGISNVRVRANSVVEGVEIRSDTAREGFENMRGIRLSNYSPEPDTPPAVVRNCRIELTDVTGSDAAIELSENLTAGEIYDTEIHIDVDDVPALRAKSPVGAVGEGDGPTGIRCENVHITGSGGRESAVYVTDRNECRFEALCVHQTGINQNGVELIRSDNNIVRNSYFDITGEPVLLREATLDVSSFRTQPIEDDPLPLDSHNCGLHSS